MARNKNEVASDLLHAVADRLAGLESDAAALEHDLRVGTIKGKGARAELARLRDEIVNLAIEIAKALAPARKHMAHYELILTILDKLEAAGHPARVVVGFDS